VAVEHRHKALGVGGIAGFDDDIEDQPALAGRQVELVSVLNLPAAPGLRVLSRKIGVRVRGCGKLSSG
jgi:hypothetical protein